jgi:hypothetical protein
MARRAILPPALDKKSRKCVLPPPPSSADVRVYLPSSSLITCPFFLSEEECCKWIEFIESTESDFEVIDQSATRDFAQRIHKRRSFINEDIAESIFDRLGSLIPSEVDSLRPRACSSNIRLYKYEEGNTFGPHIDESNRQGNLISKFTVLVYLTDVPSCDGGRTIFYKDHKCKRELAAISPEKGLLLVHCHGDRCLTHESELLKKGLKYVIRTDVLYGE